ncbi:alcohol dehydrogenase catalytic domain-containing protein [Pyrodictium abyssi]|uniref:Alcohol dehydrogenase-like N-terminal domain-containing protein n=1 Tax=Pyrodictium abyssi TaxID=54256 RepID=A0ABM8IZX5_9CREN|nr:hypothetical protein PABY_22110 [Pyrodictium abyssi]
MASEYKAIVWRGEPQLEQRLPPLVPRGWVLLRVESARWCPLDTAVAAGILPAENGVVMGCSGAGTVVELGVDANTSLAGKRAALVHVDEHYLPPLRGDGFLAGYVSVPSTHLAEVNDASPLAAFLLDSSLACEAASKAADADRVLVAGCGGFGLFAALALADMGYRVSLYTGSSSAKRLAKSLGLELVEKPGQRYDAVVAASLDVYMLERVLSASRPRKLLLHPVFAFHAWPSCRWCKRLEVVTLQGGKAGCAKTLLSKARRTVEESVGVVDGLSVPPWDSGPVLGYVFRLRV